MADQIRVQLHLGGMEAKDAWAKLEPKLRAFEAKVERATDDAVGELATVAEGLGKELKQLVERLRKS